MVIAPVVVVIFIMFELRQLFVKCKKEDHSITQDQKTALDVRPPRFSHWKDMTEFTVFLLKHPKGPSSVCCRLFSEAIFLPPASEVWGKVIFYTCLSFCSQGGLPQCMLGCCHPPEPPPPGADNPPSPRSRHTPPRADPQEQTPPPGAEHAGRYGQRAGGTHPTGMQSCSQIDSHILFV